MIDRKECNKGDGDIGFAARLRFVLFGLAVLPLALPAFDAAHAAGLKDAVRAALETNPDVGVVAENRRAIEYELDQARGEYLPTLDLRLSAGAESTSDDAIRDAGSATGDNYANLPTYESSLTLRQLLYNGNRTESEIDRRKGRVVSATRRVRETSEFIALDAIDAYLESLRQRELVAVAEENVRAHERVLDLVERKTSGGAATIADVRQAESRLATAEATLQEAEGRLRDADATYFRVVGEDPHNLDRPAPPIWAVPESLNAAVEVALRNNPSVAVTRADLEVARQAYRSSKSRYYPEVNLEITGSAVRNQDGVRESELQGTALVVMNYNLFNGFRDSNRINELAARIGEARQEHNREVRLAEEQMRIAWNALASSRDRLVAQRRAVEANDRVRETYRQQFDLGGRSLLDLLDSENELFLSRSDLVTIEFLEAFSVYRILAAGGTLLSSLDVPQLGLGRSPLDPKEPETVEFDPNEDSVDSTFSSGGFGQSEGSDEDGGLDFGPAESLDDPAPGVIDPNAPDGSDGNGDLGYRGNGPAATDGSEGVPGDERATFTAATAEDAGSLELSHMLGVGESSFEFE